MVDHKLSNVFVDKFLILPPHLRQPCALLVEKPPGLAVREQGVTWSGSVTMVKRAGLGGRQEDQIGVSDLHEPINLSVPQFIHLQKVCSK